MIGQFVQGRVYVFIDAANILYSQQTLRWRVDYKKLKEYFERECSLRAIYFYTGRVGENYKQNSFLKKLESILMSGDSDFAPLLDAVKAQHKRTLVMFTKGHVSKELLDRAKYVNLRKLRDFISYYK